MPVDWNTDFDAFSFIEYPLHEIALPLSEAIQERENFQSIENGDFDPVNPMEGDRFDTWIRELYHRIYVVALKCVRMYNDDGSPYDPSAHPVIDSVLVHGQPNGTLDGIDTTNLTFPYPNGWKRKFPREIWRLDYPGVDGDRARFVVKIGGNWEMALTTDLEYHETGDTDPAERVNAGVFFDHDGADWVESPDQMSDPDIVEEFITETASHDWAPRIGDYIDWTNLNDLKAAIKQISIFMAASEFGNYLPVRLTDAGGNSSGGVESWTDDETKEFLDSAISLATAQAGYDAAATNPGLDLAYGPHTWTLGTYNTDPDNGTYSASSARAKPIPRFTPGHTTLEADVLTLITTQKPNLGIDPSVFDAYGDGVVDHGPFGLDANWQSLGNVTQDVNLPGPFIGTIKATSPAPWYSIDWDTMTGTHFGGWTLRDTAMILDARVPNGFKYQ